MPAMTRPTHRSSRRSLARKVVVALAVWAGTLSVASPAARASAEDVEHYDARVQGYSPTVEAKSSSTGGAWMLLATMGAACVAVMFMDAKRTHLD